MRLLARERYDKLRGTGRVVIPQSLRHLALMFLLAIVFTVIGVVIVARAAVVSDPWWRMFMVVETWFGLVAIAFFGVLGTISLVTQIRRRSMITVSWRGIEESRMRGGRRVGTRTIAWEDVIAIAGVHVGGRWPSKGQYLVLLTLTPAACNRYRLGLPKWMRRLDAMNAGIIGPDAIALQRYDGGPHVMEDLLARVHRDVIGSRGFFG